MTKVKKINKKIMARVLEKAALETLTVISENPGIEAGHLLQRLGNNQEYKCFYNLIYRLSKKGFIEKRKGDGRLRLSITPLGTELIELEDPKTDGVWKIVVFDIKEKHKKVRNFLRAQLKRLHFKKWQNSIWVSPFVLPAEVEEEFQALSQKYFIRLIKTKDINRTDDLEKLFKK